MQGKRETPTELLNPVVNSAPWVLLGAGYAGLILAVIGKIWTLSHYRYRSDDIIFCMMRWFHALGVVPAPLCILAFVVWEFIRSRVNCARFRRQLAAISIVIMLVVLAFVMQAERRAPNTSFLH